MIAAGSPLDRSSPSPPASTPATRSWPVLAWVIAWLLTYFVVRIVLKQSDALGDGARIALALVPLIPFLVFLRLFVAGLRDSDELERRIQLEALAIAFPLTVVLLMVLALVELATPLSPADWSYRHVWPFVPMFYFGGIMIAARRYR